jgi:hypothetical protein
MTRLILFSLLILTFTTKGQQNINPDLFGFRTSSTFVFFDTDDSLFVKKVQSLNPKVLSFPGGLGNFYHLKGSAYGFNLAEVSDNHTGKKPKVASTFNRISRKKGHQNNYIYDFINLVKNTDAKVIYNANVLTADTVEILDIINIFYENDISLIGVELGGELTNRTYKHVMTIDKYILNVKSIAMSIGRNYPELQLIAVAAPIKPQKRHVLWNKKLSKESFFDGIITHSYAKVTKGVSEFGKMISETNERKSKKETFDLYKKRAINYLFNMYPKEINQFNKIYNNKPIWVTEWNLQMSKKTANTMLQALFSANYLLEVNANPNLKNIELATFHNMAGRTLSGSMIMKKDEKEYLLSTFHPMRLLSSCFSDSHFFINRVDISDECFKYVITTDEDKIQKRIWVNWSGNSYQVEENYSNLFLQEYYSNTLYNTTLSNDSIILSEKIFKGYDLLIKPYSITVLTSINE